MMLLAGLLLYVIAFVSTKQMQQLLVAIAIMAPSWCMLGCLCSAKTLFLQFTFVHPFVTNHRTSVTTSTILSLSLNYHFSDFGNGVAMVNAIFHNFSTSGFTFHI